MNGHAWWDHAVGYEVYIRSFADGDGDGVGDFVGLRDRLDHLAWLGVDVVWVTPFYRSPMRDWGYDVADYTEVDPAFGSLDDFDAMLARAHELGLRVIIDIVPNHSSDQHEWFQQALADPTGPYRDYYVWADPPADGSLPNNWVGYFGGPTWTLHEPTGQYYLHLFLPEQPDLNWRSSAVQQEFENILRFWLDRGVDGFRIDVAQAMVKDAELRSNPQLAPSDASMFRWEQWNAFQHDHDILQPETLDIFRRWNEIAAEYDALLLGETYDLIQLDKLDRLLSGGDALHVGFWFGAMHVAWDAKEIRETLALPLGEISAGLGWAQNSHDEHRSATRFGGGDIGRQRALSLSVLLCGLPGLPFLYQGEELGLESAVLPASAKRDPVGGEDPNSGRDATRTPITWAPGPGWGFTSSDDPWLPFGDRTDADTVEVQRGDETSWLHRTKALLDARKTVPQIAGEPLVWLDLDDDMVGFARGQVAFVLNTGPDRELPIEGELLYRSAQVQGPLVVDEAAIVAMSGEQS